MSRLALVLLCVAALAGCRIADDGPGVSAGDSESSASSRVAGADVAPTGSLPDLADLTDLVPTASAPDVSVVDGSHGSVDIVSGDTPLVMPATVAVVGDSLTLSAEDDIAGELTGLGLDVLTIDGLESRRMARGDVRPRGTGAIEAIKAAGVPDLWVIALGTNDVGAQAGSDVFVADMVDVLALIPPDDPVVWVDLYIRDLADDIAEANASIRTVLQFRRGLSVVVDWNSHGDDPGVITDDGVHLTRSGRALFASSIADAIEVSFRS